MNFIYKNQQHYKPMKKLLKSSLLLFAFTFFTYFSFSQNTTDDIIIGKWKVLKVISAKSNTNTKEFINSLSAATFVFDKNKTFRISTTKNSELFKMFASMTNEKKWISKSNNLYAIGSKSDNYSIMGIIYKSKKDIITFTLDESNIELQVEKIQ